MMVTWHPCWHRLSVAAVELTEDVQLRVWWHLQHLRDSVDMRTLLQGNHTHFYFLPSFTLERFPRSNVPCRRTIYRKLIVVTMSTCAIEILKNLRKNCVFHYIRISLRKKMGQSDWAILCFILCIFFRDTIQLIVWTCWSVLSNYI